MAYTLAKYQEKINNAQQILIVYGSSGDFSAAAVATSLYLWLRHLEKRVQLVCPAVTTVDLSHLVGINKVKNKLHGENIVLKLPLAASQIDKVISDVDALSDTLSLVIKPKANAKAVTAKNVAIGFQPPEYDLIFYVDVREVGDLQAIALDDKEFWSNPEKNITFNSFANPSPLTADIAEVLGRDTGLAEFWAGFLFDNQMAIDSDQASNLLMALERETDGFRPERAAASDFELAAWLMRQGGTRFVRDEKAAADFRPENHLPQVPTVIDFAAKAQADT